MTIASLLLALCTAAPSASSDAASQPVLLDFHAEWCGPCQKMRPVIKQLIRNKYPVRSIDIDHDPDDLADALPRSGCPHVHRGRRLGPRAGSHQGHNFGSRPGTVLPGRRGQGGADDGMRTTVSPRARSRGPGATTMKRTREPRASRNNGGNRPEEDAEERPTGLYQPQTLGILGSDPGGRSPLDRFRLGHHHLQHARGVADPDVCAYFSSGRCQEAGSAIAKFPRQDHHRPVRRQTEKATATKPRRSTSWSRSRARRSTTISTRDVGSDPDPARPATAGFPGCAGALGTAIPDEYAHGRLLGGRGRDGLAHGHHRAAQAEFLVGKTGVRGDRVPARHPSRGVPAADCSRMMDTSRACATSPSRKAIMASMPRLGRSTTCSIETT